ncbi:hypothetical protein GQR58_010515 [Nymphon striatum]|nr:hypothetical protein GQR58_010515 [Nymphon striatum]
MSNTQQRIISTIAKELSSVKVTKESQVKAAIELLDDGATVPFISRYRKEVTGAIDDQGKLTDELTLSIQSAETKTSLEDLYLPYKPKRRTKATIAIESGLLPLADALYNNPNLNPEVEAEKYLSDSEENPVADVKKALEGARYILMDRFSEDAALLARTREYMERNALVIAKVAKGKEQEGVKFKDYFDYQEPFKRVPSHRALAMFRGRNEGILYVTLDVEAPGEYGFIKPMEHPCEKMVAGHWNISDNGRPADAWLLEVASWTWKIKMHTHISGDLMNQLREQAETEAIRVFSLNLKDLLLAAPAGAKVTIGLDPGLRTGVKVAVVDSTGQYLDQSTIYPHAPKNQWNESIAAIGALAKKHNAELIAVGNGTASRETDKLAGDIIKQYPGLRLTKVMVNEAGASVYSASEFAAKEFPDLDVTIRGAVSIARRLQDPLAELVKIEPKSIGVGQYQHDVNQYQLTDSLETVIEDCVNDVGVDLNTASMPLLKQVSGLNETLANNIVDFRNDNGSFTSRKMLKEVPRMGAKSFEQSAGFLRIIAGSENPLDASGVHPEAYSVVKAIATKTGKKINDIIGDTQLLKSLNPADYVTEKFGLPTVTDIIAELDKPGRDPRPEFKTASLKDGIEKISDLKEDMILEGTVTNVTNFGAFVDVGVHQDGLVHISCLADKFVDDPHKVVKAGQIVKVKVQEVDLQRKRIALTMRLTDNSKDRLDTKDKPNQTQKKPQRTQKPNAKKSGSHQKSNQGQRGSNQAPTNSLADKLSAALKGGNFKK